MKIAHVVGTFPPHIGGMGKVAREESQNLLKNGHDVTVFTLAYPKTVYNDEAELYKIVRLPVWFKSGDAGSVPGLFNQLKGFDLVHLHYPFYGGAEWVWLANLLHKQKYVVTYHMQARPSTLFRKIIQKVYDLFLSGVILKNAKKILVVDKEYFLSVSRNRFIIEDKIIELSNPVDISLFAPRQAFPNDIGLTRWSRQKIILFVGNLMSGKRLDLVLEALPQLNSESVLVVVGSGYGETTYKNKVVLLGLSERVQFVGSVIDQARLARYYNAAWCTVVPSDAESFSLVAAEALSSGCPVVASDIVGIRDRVENGVDGFLFAPGSVKSLAENLNKMLALSLDERTAMGESGRRKVVNQYSLKQHVDRLEKIYESVLC